MHKMRILVVDDESDFTKLLKWNLEKEGNYEVREENDASQTLTTIKNFHPDMILMDLVMPNISGAEIASQIRANESLKQIPMIFLTAAVSEQEVHLPSGLMGGYPFIAKPVKIEDLIVCIEKNIPKKPNYYSVLSGKKILIIDDEPSFTRLFKLNLEKNGNYQVQEENKGSQALETARLFKPDLIILDIMMPDIDGSEIASQLKSDNDLQNIPVIFLTAVISREEVDSNIGGLIGGHPFIPKPASVEEIVECIEKTFEAQNKSRI